jgi:hypothetical protein
VTTTPTAPLTLDAAPEQLKVVAWRDDGLSAGNDSDGTTYRVVSDKTKQNMPRAAVSAYVEPLCSLTEAQSALSAQAATIAQLEARLREAEAVIRGHYGKQCPDCPRDWLLDAAIAAHGKDGAHD